MHCVRTLFAVFACILAGAGFAATRPTDAEISALVAKYAGTAISERQDMHKNPELSNRETRTGALVAARLKSLGIDVQSGIAHTGAEDFSYFSQVVPDGKSSTGHHTPGFYAADEPVPIAMRLMTSLVIDYLDSGAPR